MVPYPELTLIIGKNAIDVLFHAVCKSRQISHGYRQILHRGLTHREEVFIDSLGFIIGQIMEVAKASKYELDLYTRNAES